MTGRPIVVRLFWRWISWLAKCRIIDLERQVRDLEQLLSDEVDRTITAQERAGCLEAELISANATISALRRRREANLRSMKRTGDEAKIRHYANPRPPCAARYEN